ncbi:MAG: HAD-IA family hydrolase [Treponemataceae bacterium]|nr:HAD-IA family hydrolase [Treponemataceae bacterium]
MSEKIKHLLFDLDNTLYSSSALINAKISERFMQFVSDYLQISLEEAAVERQKGLTQYGTTLEWLKAEKKLKDAELFFKAVHPSEEVNEVPFDPKLREFLLSLNMPMSLLSNAPYEHAERILKKLKVLDLFRVIYDLRANKMHGKPNPDAYLAPINAAGFTVENTLFIDDIPKYVKGFAAIGGTAVLIDEKKRFSKDDWNGFCINSLYALPDVLKKL